MFKSKITNFFIVFVLVLLFTNTILVEDVHAHDGGYPTKAQMKKKYKWEIKKPKMRPLVFDIDYDNYDLKFTDIPKNHAHRKSIIWAVENGIIKNEKKKFRPDDTMIMRELFDYLYHLRIKYHYDKINALMGYNFLKRTGFLDIKEDDEYFIVHTKMAAFPFYAYKKLYIGSGVAYYLDGKYSPNLKVNRFCILSIPGLFRFRGVERGIHKYEKGTIVSDPLNYDPKIFRPKLQSILRSFPDEGTNKLATKKAIASLKGTRPLLLFNSFSGIQVLQRINMFPVEFTYKDLNLKRLYSRAEVFDFMFEYCSRFTGDGKPGTDFRTQKPYW